MFYQSLKSLLPWNSSNVSSLWNIPLSSNVLSLWTTQYMNQRNKMCSPQGTQNDISWSLSTMNFLTHHLLLRNSLSRLIKRMTNKNKIQRSTQSVNYCSLVIFKNITYRSKKKSIFLTFFVQYSIPLHKDLIIHKNFIFQWRGSCLIMCKVLFAII